MTELLLIFVWLWFAFVVGVAANTRGRDTTGWLLLACLVSPLLAGFLLLALPRREAQHGSLIQRWCDGPLIRRWER